MEPDGGGSGGKGHGEGPEDHPGLQRACGTNTAEVWDYFGVGAVSLKFGKVWVYTGQPWQLNPGVDDAR